MVQRIYAIAREYPRTYRAGQRRFPPPGAGNLLTEKPSPQIPLRRFIVFAAN